MKKLVTNSRIALLTAFALALGMSQVRADILQLGGTFSSPIPMNINGTLSNEGGGSIEPSSLNGNTLAWVYCVDLFRNISVPGTWSSAVVTTTGVVNGSLVNNAGEVAWLLSKYGVAGQGDQAKALQAAIWHVIFDGVGGNTVALDSTAPIGVKNDYNNMLAALGSNTGNVSDFLWLTPGGNNHSYQGLVTPVPEPTTMIAGALLLLPFGASAMRIIRRKA